MKLFNSLTNRVGGNNRTFTVDVLKLVGGTTIAQALTVLFAPILTRLYQPEAFGIAAIFTSIVTIFSVIASLRYEFAIMLPDNDGKASNVLALSLAIVVLMTGLSAGMLYALQEPLLDWLNAPQLEEYLCLIPLVILFMGAFQCLNYWNSRTKKFGRLSIARVSASITTILGQLGLAILGYASAGGLIIASVAGTGAVTGILGAQIWRDDKSLFKKNIRLTGMLENLIRYRKFPLVDTWGGFINNLAWQIPTLLLAYYFSEIVVGYFALTNRLVQIPMSVIGASIAQVFFQRASEVRMDQAQLITVVENVFRRLVALSLFPTIMLVLTGQEWFTLIFGAQWLEAGKYIQILGIWLFFWFISSPMSTLFSVLERQELAFGFHLAILLTRLGSLVIGGSLENVYLALWLYAITGVMVYGFLSIFVMNLTGVKFLTILRILAEYSLYALPGTLVIILLKLWEPAPTVLILVVSVIALLAYFWVIYRQNRSLLHW